VPKLDRIGHEQIAEYYQQHPEEFMRQDSVTWQDIFIDFHSFQGRGAAEQEFQRVVARAQAGEDFLRLVKQYDRGDSTYRNGEGYGHRKGEIKPPEAEPLLFQMKEGQLARVELANGIHLIRLAKREYAGLKPFDEKTQTAIRNKLQMGAWDKEYKRLVNELRRKAAIEVAVGTN
jgi:parvulin-like peptidyl-prolyl isomerase